MILRSILSLAILCSTCAVLRADEDRQSLTTVKAEQDSRIDRKAKKSATRTITASREAAALAFVGEHHAPLVELLDQLKRKNPNQYERAIRELFATSERLAGVHERNPERYELELRIWKLKSRIELLAARATMDSSEEFEDELRDALKQQTQARLQLLKLERNQLTDRLERVENNIAQLEGDEAELVERQFQRLTGAIKKSKAGKAALRQQRKAKSQQSQKSQPNS